MIGESPKSQPERERGTILPAKSLAYASGYDQHHLQVAALSNLRVHLLAVAEESRNGIIDYQLNVIYSPVQSPPVEQV
ncbi:MAG: hypothetical protein MUC83_05255 [Pirellula sp.]|nr:hypothetical protein [Pirellula sp.]